MYYLDLEVAKLHGKMLLLPAVHVISGKLLDQSRSLAYNCVGLSIQPSIGQLMNAGRKFPPNYLHESWTDYLYWDAELES